MSGQVTTIPYNFDFKGSPRTALSITPVVILDQSSGNATVDVSSWGVTPLTSKEYVYYTGIEAGNPGGAITNIKDIIYKYDGDTIYTSRFTYTSDSRVLSTTSV